VSKNPRFLTALGAASLLLAAVLVRPARAELEVGVEYSSSYIWRGFDLNPNQRPIVVGGAAYGFGRTGIALEAWGIFSFADREVNEFDLVLSYTYPGLKSVELTGGLIHYGWYFAEDFRFGYDTSHEAFLRAVLTGLPFRPSLEVFYDFTNGDGLYARLGAEQSFRLWKMLGLRVRGSLGYNGGQWLAEGAEPGFSDLDLGLELPVGLGRLRLVPFFRETFVLLKAIGRRSYSVYGLALSYSFEAEEPGGSGEGDAAAGFSAEGPGCRAGRSGSAGERHKSAGSAGLRH
jgi:hypothetical protein